MIQATGLPGRTVTITRRPKKYVEEEFRFRQQIAAACESMQLLVRPQKKKEVDIEIDSDGEMLFKVDSPVECDYEGKGEYWPSVVRRVNDNGSYDVEYVGDYKWVGIQRGVDPEVVQKRGESDKKARGEGVWSWDGMSDSEEDDFERRLMMNLISRMKKRDQKIELNFSNSISFIKSFKLQIVI